MCRASSTETCAVVFPEQAVGVQNIQVESNDSASTPPQVDISAPEQSAGGQNIQVESNDSASTPPQVDISALEQLSGGQSQQLIPSKSFFDFVTVPNRSSRRVAKRKKMSNYNITSDEHLEFIAAKEVKKPINKANEGDRTKKGQKRKYTKLEQKVENENNKPKSKAKNSTYRKSASRKKGKQSASNDQPCLYCKETFSECKWIQCQICTMWAHYECAGVDDNVFNFICEVCN